MRLKIIKFIIIGEILLISLILFKVVQHKKSEQPKEVEVCPVVQSEVISTVSAVGKIVCLDFYKIDTKANLRVFLPLESPEKGGDIICILANPEEKKLIQSASQNLQLANFELEDAHRRLEEAERRYTRNLKNLSLELEMAREQHKKTQKLYQAGAVPKQQLIEAENLLKRAELQYEEAEEKTDIHELETQFKKTRIQLENSRQEMEAVLDSLKEKTILGGMDVDRVIEVKIDEFDIRKVKVGQFVTIRGSGLSQELSGQVLKIGAKVVQDRDQSYIRAIASIEDMPEIELKPGLAIEAEIEVAHLKNVLVIPLAAVLEKEGGKVVYVAEKGRAGLRSVEVGLSGQEVVQIKKGLQKGDLVVTLGNLDLKDGDPVKVKNVSGDY